MSGVIRAIGSIIRAVEGPITGLILDGGKGFVHGIQNAVTAFVGGPVAAALSIGSQLLTKKPSNSRQGQQLNFKIDPGGPIDYVMGRTSVGGRVAHRETFGSDNKYETFFVVLGGGGPYHAIEAFQCDRVTVPLSGMAATGYYGGWMWQDQQLGATPESDALVSGVGGSVPGWGSAYKLSGYAAASWTLQFDSKGKRYANGEPAPSWIVQGALAYDPRLDSTYPGGSGPCRWAPPSDRVAHQAARATWVYSETPALYGLMWRLGIWQCDESNPASVYRRIMGIGAPIELIDLAAIVASANVQEANGWKVGGFVDSAMDKWNALKLIEEAGGSVPVPSGALMSTMQKAPRTSLATITAADLADGAITVPGMVPRRTRLNGYRARIRSEANAWEMTDLDLIEMPDYVTADKGRKTGSGDFSLVQDPDQGASLAAYAVLDSRELTGIVLPLKPRWAEYRLGHCLTLDIPELLLTGLDVIVKGRQLDPSTGIVTLTFDTETFDKHAVALGQTGTLPPAPTLAIISDEPPAPDPADWTLSGVTISNGSGTIPALQLVGAIGNSNASEAIVAVRSVPALLSEEGTPILNEDGTPLLSEADAGDWMAEAPIAPAATIRLISNGIAPNGAYQVAISYRVRGIVGDPLILGPVIAGALGVSRACYELRTLDPAFPVTPGDGSLTIVAFTAVLDDGRSMAFPAHSVTGLASGTTYGLFWNLSTGAYEVDLTPALSRRASSNYVFLEFYTTSTSGVFADVPSPPPGYGGGGPREVNQLV